MLRIKKVKYWDALILCLLLGCLILVSANETEISKRIVVPYLVGNKSLYLFVIIAIGWVIQFILMRETCICKIEFLLVVRGILFIFSNMIPATDGNIQVGIVLAVCIAPFAFSIGRKSKIKHETIAFICTLAGVVIASQIIYTYLYHGLNILDMQNLKWWMVIPIGQTNNIGSYLLFFLVMADDLRNRTSRVMWKSLLYVALIIISIAFFIMGSRASLLMFSIYLFIRYCLPRASKDKKYKTRLLGILFISLIAVIYLLIMKLSFIYSVMDLFDFNSLTSTRFQVYAESIILFWQHPFFGRGTVPFAVGDAVMTHNLVLEALVQSGIMGTVFFIAALFKTFRKLHNRTELGYCYYYIFVLLIIRGMVEPTFFLLGFEIIFWLMMGYGYRFSKWSKNMLIERIEG